MKTIFNDLRQGNGAVVISSAGGVEYALEGDRWNNSVFTYSLLYGLRKKESDINNDGIIKVTELQKYLGLKVSELTNGRQKPTSRVENLENDFSIP